MNNVDCSRKIALNECQKLFVQRDYSLGCTVLFDTSFPPELDHKVDIQTWLEFIEKLNQIYAGAISPNSASVFECLLGFFTCYLSRLCLISVWERKLREVENFLAEMNNLVFVRRGLFVCNPMEKGLRVLEIVLLDEPMPKYQSKPALNDQTLILQPR